ncbi:RING-14 protein-like protein [Cenococcum geophilum 1.58]|uniref:RING-14 protein-like protein n=1 Tax=Cenococcum geophilum 1.58 TaxID=794803 RepID=UPI00359003B4|nr:RING-14 protein-like protein [Cenococcum geophilum 1.58]
MKFGHIYQERLLKGGFPPEWVESAISYRKLKKCIHKVEGELASLGLDPNTLSSLLRHFEKINVETADAEDVEEKPFEYVLAKDEEVSTGGSSEEVSWLAQRPVFHPKLLFTVDEETGEPLNAHLAPETKEKLYQMALLQGMSDIRITELSDFEVIRARPGTSDSAGVSFSDSSTVSTERRRGSSAVRLIEVPLTSDSEFFAMLSTELSGLAALQAQEEQKLYSEISQLSKVIAHVTEPNPRAKKQDLVKWRKIFQLYVESRIFFAATERDHGAHNTAKAGENFRAFSRLLEEHELTKHFKKQESIDALNKFLGINMELLQTLRFQEINYIAMTKILKKFDKRTALGVMTTFPKAVEIPVFSRDLAKAICFQVSQDILTSVPLLDDYLCPICFNIVWRPVKLRCQHVFCIRCLIVMQRDRNDHCPLCREKGVMEANKEHLDDDLAKYLTKWFPEEVKAKQKENEFLAGVDEYGEAYKTKCAVM